MFDMIPQGWKIVELSEIADGDYGIVDGPFGSNLKVSDYIDDSVNVVPVLTTKNLNGDYSKDSVRYISKEKFDSLKRSAVTPGDIIVAKIGTIGKCGIYPLDQRIALIPANLLKITPKSDVNRKYVFYYIQSAEFQKWIKSIATSTAQPAFNVTKFRKLPIPIPSLPEQNRIVARIEELFSELDNGVETLRKTKQQLAVYRQAVLETAFRECASKENVQFGDILSEKPRNGYSPKGVDYQTKYRNLTLTATTSGYFRDNCFKYVDIDIDDDSYLWVKHNDILIQRANTIEYVGTTVLYQGEDNRYVYPDLMMKCHTKDGINPQFVVYQLQSRVCKTHFREHATGTSGSMPKINQQTVMTSPIVMTSLDEQERIVKQIGERLSVCDSIEKTVDTALLQAEAMRQSILKQAFEGRL